MTGAPGFGFDKDKILNLLTGERFYETNGAAVREGVMNALDACHRQKEKADDEYMPDISVIFDTSEHKLIIEDNGDGMDEDDIRSLFTEVGKSAKDLGKDGSEDQIGEFGIGVISYFLISNHFDVYSKANNSNQIGYRFSESMFKPGETAEELSKRDHMERGTRVVFHLNEEVSIDELESAYKDWIKSAEEVSAVEKPANEKIPQDGVPDVEEKIDIDTLPDWIEEAEIGVGVGSDKNNDLLGIAKIEVLYRGVHLNTRKIGDFWGIKGSIHVSPDEIEPELNREDYLETGSENKLESFLEVLHPQVLNRGSKIIDNNIDNSKRPTKQQESITQYMSISRNSKYSDAIDSWDDTFQNVSIVEELTPDGRKPLSIDEIKSMDADAIYYVKRNPKNAGALVREATSVLRKTDPLVVTGVKTKNSVFENKPPKYSNTIDFLINEFNEQTPEFKQVKKNKREIIEKDNKLIKIFTGNPVVKAVSLGSSSEPFVILSDEVWLNAPVIA